MKCEKYTENLYFSADDFSLTDKNRNDIVDMLQHNHSVGICGGYYDEGYPICFINNYLIMNLGGSKEHIPTFTKGKLIDYIHPDNISFFEDGSFKKLYGEHSLRIFSYSGEPIWISIYKTNSYDINGKEMWIVSVRCIQDEYDRENMLKNAIKEKEDIVNQYARIANDLADTVSILAKMYKKALKVNLTTGAFKEIVVSEADVEMDTTRSSCIFEWMRQFGENGYVFEDDLEEYFEFVDADNMRRRFRNGASSECIKYRRLQMGEYIWVKLDVMKSLEYTDDNQIVMVYVTDIDSDYSKEISTKKAIEVAYEEARSANAAKTEFLSKMSHDIRTPINAIVGMTALAESNINNPVRIMDCLRKINVASRHLGEIINDVLEVSKIESGKPVLSENEFRLTDLIQNMITMVDTQIKSYRHDFTVLVHELEHDHVIGDSLKIQQAFLNIMSNAIKYTPVGGKIRLEISELPSENPDMGRYEFVFSDNGIGMTEEEISNIFTPFERGTDARISRIQGTGLGMPIVNSIVHMMNGNITVESKKDEGSKFTVDICLKLQKRNVSSVSDEEPYLEMTFDDMESDDGENAAKSFIPNLSEYNFSGHRILLVEDNENNREVAYEFLKMTGAEIDTAINGREALDMVMESSDGYYELILMDVQMPEMNGYEATSAIRSLNRKDAKNMPIFAMTANAFVEDVLAARNAGMNEHIAKPLEFDKLLNLISKWIIK